MIRAVNVCKSYDNNNTNVPVLQDISLNVENGKFVAITGNSGSGKSTLLYTLSGLLTADKGEVYIDNTDIMKLNDSKMSEFRCNNIGFVFQSYNIIPTMTIEENIRLPIIIANRELGKKKDIIDKLMKDVGLYDKRNKKAGYLSGGEQQRVSIARSLVNNPKIVFADEPTGNLDSQNADMILKLLRKLCDDFKTTILMVTHNLESTSICDDVIKIKDGRICSSK
ncbi:ABC transporter ATP-binding protein [Clostridium hydrogenum]|uniref:ABC transporter ATP-binding protein n=1 Tax=Clostridium hydrogenum TaxID=2855764 RepID=UPI001F398C82|nr:ABC transporter ATP-binding protein [Clostridium hydrogenum]